MSSCKDVPSPPSPDPSQPGRLSLEVTILGVQSPLPLFLSESTMLYFRFCYSRVLCELLEAGTLSL